MERMDAPDEKPEAASRPETGHPPRSGYLGFVAHEVRNPLSTALWTAELLARMTAVDRAGPRGEKLSAMCLRSVGRVRQLIEDHFLCERLDAGGLSLRTEAVGAREAIAAVMERRPGETASIEVDPGVGVEADRALLERAIESLIALAGEEQTAVGVTVSAGEDEVSFAVRGRRADATALADPVKGSPSDPTGRALAVPLARRIASALGGALTVREGAWLLTLPRAPTYTPRPDTAASP